MTDWRDQYRVGDVVEIAFADDGTWTRAVVTHKTRSGHIGVRTQGTDPQAFTGMSKKHIRKVTVTTGDAVVPDARMRKAAQESHDRVRPAAFRVAAISLADLDGAIELYQEEDATELSTADLGSLEDRLQTLKVKLSAAISAVIALRIVR